MEADRKTEDDALLIRWRHERDALIRETEAMERRLDNLSQSIFRRTEFLTNDGA